MSSGYSASYADVVTEDFINEILEKAGEPDLLTKFYDAFSNGGITGDDIIYGFSGLQKYHYEWLLETFQQHTGLYLEIGFHDSENGDTYDEVNGIFWNVGGVYRYTEAGEKYKDKIIRSFYVTYG
jgi:hypothetical protein